MKNKFKLVLLLTTILLANLVLAVTPSSIKVKILVQNNTIQIQGDDIIDFKDIFSVSYIYSIGNCSNSTANITSFNYTIDYTKDTELVFVSSDFNKSELSCYNELNKANDKWVQCYSDNMNISIANALCQQDRGYKDNYTTCQVSLVNANAQISSKDTEKTSIQKSLDDEKSGTWQKYGLGALAGIVGCYLYLRRKGETAPVRFGGENFPQNPSNLA